MERMVMTLRRPLVTATLLWLLIASTGLSQSTEDIQESAQWRSPAVQTPFGRVVGSWVAPNVAAYRGIPYAQPPVGELRFQPPTQPRYTGNRTIDATEYGGRCVQFLLDLPINVVEPGPDTEDCLTVNVFVPQKLGSARAGKTLPVFVWVHGGGWLEGYSSAYDPTAMLQQFPDMIVVTFNYRLGLFGYPHSDAINNTSSNLGQLDQRHAIEWVRDHIRSFGGNPQHIIAGGHSAGSASLSHYLFAYSDDPIIKGTFMMSGPASLITTPRNPAEFQRVALEVGCRVDDSAEAELGCMRTMDTATLKRAISPRQKNPVGSGGGGLPAVDGITWFSVKEQQERFESGRVAKIPVVVGSVEHEWDNLMPYTPRGINHTVSDLLTLSSFYCPIAGEAKARSSYPAPTWRYFFRGIFTSPALRPYPWLRSYHGLDMFLLFNGNLFGLSEERIATTNLRATLVAFVRDPQRGLKEISWPVYDPESPTLVQLFADNNSPQFTIEDQRILDRACENPPPPPFEALAIQPPPCDPCFGDAVEAANGTELNKRGGTGS